MVTYSAFQYKCEKTGWPYEVPVSKDYKVYVNGEEIPVYTCRISAYPFNTVWPGHQRSINQTEIVSYVNLVSDEAVNVEVEPLTKKSYDRIMVKPYSKGVKAEKAGNRIAFTLKENGGYLFELDDYHGCLYLFNNKPVICEDPKEVTYYFGKGVHFPGKITLKSNESVYLEKDALVYGCIYARDAENIRVYGNGIFDDSGEERFYGNCAEFVNGNVKLIDCKNVKVEGIGITNSAIWCFNVFRCSDVEIDGINLFGQWRYNTDGIDVVNSSRITIRNSFVHSFDDSVTIKGFDMYSEKDCTDMLIENCVLCCDWGKALEIGLETGCREYRNIVFKNCDVIRGGNAVCDIQNGDCAEVHDIAFEDIRVELESFYTPEVYQASQDMTYGKEKESAVAAIVSIVNRRYCERDVVNSPYVVPFPEKRFASVRDIIVKDLTVYFDEKLTEERSAKEAIVIRVANEIETTEYRNIRIENIVVNGKRLTKEDMTIVTDGTGKIDGLEIE